MKRFFLLCLLSACMVSGCVMETQSQRAANVDFFAQVQTTSNNEVEISLQVSPNKDFESDPNFNGTMKLFNEDHELRAEANFHENPVMKKDELYQLFTWRGQLDPGSYQLDWYSANYAGTEVFFEVRQTSAGLIAIENLVAKSKSSGTE